MATLSKNTLGTVLTGFILLFGGAAHAASPNVFTHKTVLAEAGDGVDDSATMDDFATPAKKEEIKIDAGTLMKQAEDTVKAVFTYSHDNYQRKLKVAQKYFSQGGWEAFRKALDKSKNLVEVKETKMTVTSKIDSKEIKLLNQSVEQGKKHWTLMVPVLVQYKNDKEDIRQRLGVEVTFIRVPTSENISGIAVTQFVAKNLINTGEKTNPER